MPTFDTGHLFLTFLSPIRRGQTQDAFGVTVSHEQAVRESLSLLPTSLQSPATSEQGSNSPFTRNLRTHLCRFVVIEDVIFNGREQDNAILTALATRVRSAGRLLGITDPITPRGVDRLNCAYLAFVADVDAVMEEGDPLPAELDEEGQNRTRDAWARRLWETMAPEVRSIYDHCEGFAEVKDGDGFAGYLARCQVETTMPFNDYWISPPALNNLPVVRLAATVGIPAVLCVLGLLGMFLGMESAGLFWFGLVVTGLAAFWAIRFISVNGRKPMPPAKYGDLPSVLKSLYLQQKFSDFVVNSQGRSNEELHAAFGEFITTHRPGDRMTPSQPPGVISAEAARMLNG